MKNYIVGFVAVTALIVGGLSYTKAPDVVVGSQGKQGIQGERGPVGPAGKDGRDGKDAVARFGATAGTEFYSNMTFYAGEVFSATFATTSTGAGTLTASNIKDKSTVLSTNAGALTLTLPASTTLTSFIPKAGDRVSMLLVNQGTALLTLAGGTGTLLQTASSTKTVNIGGTATLEFVRKTNSDIVVHMDPAI
jgi:hypothetical protein